MGDIEVWEDHFFKEDKRANRKERKIASKTDRSKYKKTDQDKIRKSNELHGNIKGSKEDYSKGRVITISSRGYEVDSEGQIYICSLRGLLKREKGQDKNLITVGDIVLFEKLGSGEGQIVHVEERYSFLSRADNLSRRKQQLIASNIDQVLITCSVVLPPLKPYLVDRYIIAAMKGNMAPMIVVNKVDLLEKPGNEAEKELYKEFVKAYRNADIQVLEVSAETGMGLDKLKLAMKDKASVFSGQSGVGKTSLINLVTGGDLKTSPAVDKTKKGSHTTSKTNLIPLAFGGFCIDTPGIKSFGVWNLTKDEIAGYFPDIEEIGKGCKYQDCSHTGEEGCHVLASVEKGNLSPLRFESYLYLCQSLSEEHLRR